MTPEEYWNMLELEIEKFDKKNVVASSAQDNKEYEKQKNTLLQVAKIAHEANQCWTPIGKKDCLKRAEALILNKETFGEQGIPAMVGKKTRDFVELVYVPHLRARKEIDFGWQIAILNTVLQLAGSNDTIEDRIRHAQQKAEKLAGIIKEYDQRESLLEKQSLFASSPENNNKPEEVKPLSLNL